MWPKQCKQMEEGLMQSFGVNNGVLLNITAVLCSLNTDNFKIFRRKVSRVKMYVRNCTFKVASSIRSS
jgi:hypothetical protein